MGNPSPLRAERTRPRLWPLRFGPGCCRCSTAAAPGKRRPALTAWQSLPPAPKVIMEEETSGPDRARGYSCCSGQDSGARGLAAAAPAPPSPPPFSSNSSSSSPLGPPSDLPPRPPSAPSTFKAPRPSLKGTAPLLSRCGAPRPSYQAPRRSLGASC